MMTKYQILQSGGVFDFETRTIVLPDQSSAAWHGYQNWLTAGNTPLPPDTIGQDTLAVAIEKRKSEIDAYAAGLRNAVIRGYSSAELSSWSLKLIEARAYIATSDINQAPLLNATAQVRGITISDMANRVMTNSAQFLQLEATIDGIRGKHCDAVGAMTTVQGIITYDWHSGWPIIH
jgi:hypothetical protein